MTKSSSRGCRAGEVLGRSCDGSFVLHRDVRGAVPDLLVVRYEEPRAITMKFQILSASVQTRCCW